MSCPRTEHILQEYFADDLAPLAGEEIARHLEQCTICSAELDALLQTRSRLEDWQDCRVPHWDRGLTLFRNEQRLLRQPPGQPTPPTMPQHNRWFGFWQWLPAAASLVMLSVLWLNTSVTLHDSGLTLGFGSQSDAALAAALADFQQQQHQELQAAMARLEARQASNNLELWQAVMAENRQITAANLERLYARIEEQRLQDMETLRIGYQQLVDSDYVTFQSLQDLARYVNFQGNVQ